MSGISLNSPNQFGAHIKICEILSRGKIYIGGISIQKDLCRFLRAAFLILEVKHLNLKVCIKIYLYKKVIKISLTFFEDDFWKNLLLRPTSQLSEEKKKKI